MTSSILFFATQCDFANRVRDDLLRAGHELRAVITPGQHADGPPIRERVATNTPSRGPALPMARSAIQVPEEARLPESTRMLELNRPAHPTAREYIAGLHADIAVVCCYPRRLPVSLVDNMRLSALNVHPSLLPAYRGPDPLFWVFRNGETETGVTIHRVEASLDSGAVFAQATVPMPIGTPGDYVWERLSAEAGASLAETIAALEGGWMDPRPQDHARSSYQSWPGPEDLKIVPGEWAAWHAYHFCRGVIPMGYAPVLVREGSVQRVRSAEDYGTHLGEARASVPGQQRVQFADGWVRMRLGPPVF